MKRLPVDVSSFPTLIEGGYVYVDKTRHIYQLISTGRLYFLSRPRRFGKSLLISTLAELFSGNKELFKGLWIYEHSPYAWEEYPVIHLDFSLLAFETSSKLEISLSWLISHIAQKYGVDVTSAPFPGNKIQVLIEALAQKNKVVILIDEYDYPIINSLSKRDVTNENRAILRQFFSALKGLDGHIRAIFLTGVSKFSKTSIFLGFNNLNDITMDPLAGSLLGYTKEELMASFSPHLEALAHEMHKKVEEVLQEITLWYNGYRFSIAEQLVYNPYSVLYLLQKKVFANYWFTSGTPAFLLQLLKEQYYEMIDLQEIALPVESLGTFELENIPLIPLLYQAGYLTLREFDRANLCKLDFPNLEVRESFNRYLLATFAGTEASQVNTSIARLQSALNQEDLSLFMSTLQLLFAHIPYQLHIPQEKYYHSLFQLLGSLLDPATQSEVCTDKGRIDLVIQTKKVIYLFEIKLDGTPEEALEQIQARKYHERYLITGKKITLVGISFNRHQDRLVIEYKAINFI